MYNEADFPCNRADELNKQRREIYQCDIRYCSCRKVDFAVKKNNPMGRITAVSKVFFRKTSSLENLSGWLSRGCGALCVLAVYPLKMALDLYGNHPIVTTVTASKSKHVPRLSLATQGGGDSVVRLEVIGRVGERRRRRRWPGVPVCGSHYCETRMDDIRDWRRQRGSTWRGERRPNDGDASCAIARA